MALVTMALTKPLTHCCGSCQALLLRIRIHGTDQRTRYRKDRLTQVVTALPQILDEVRNATPEQLEQLLTHITETFPGLEGVLPQQGGRKMGRPAPCCQLDPNGDFHPFLVALVIIAART